MKKIILSLLTAFVFINSPVLADQTEGIQRDVVVKVNGMVCDFCAQSIKKVFGKQDSVAAVDVDLDKGEIIIDLKDGQKIDHETITALVTDAGYNVTDIIEENAE